MSMSGWRWFFLFTFVGLIALVTLARPSASSGQETPRSEAPQGAARIAIVDLVMDPSPIEKGAGARFSVQVRSDYPAPVQIIVSVRGSAIGATPMGTARTVARGDSLVRIPGQRTVTVAGQQPEQRCLTVDGRVNEARPGAPAATVQIAPRKFCLEEVYILKAQ